jgi:hypothetical protein
MAEGFLLGPRPFFQPVQKVDFTEHDAAFVSGQCITVEGGLTAASPVRPGLL